MRVCLVNLMISFIICVVISSMTAAAWPNNRWYPSDPRCSGYVSGRIRLKRFTGTNNKSSVPGTLWKYNGNSGTCERIYGSSVNEYSAFESKSACDQACLNIYHSV